MAIRVIDYIEDLKSSYRALHVSSSVLLQTLETFVATFTTSLKEIVDTQEYVHNRQKIALGASS